MRFVHQSDRARRALLGYCLNLHPAHTLEEFLARTEAVAVPLRARLGCRGRFGVGPWMGATLVAELLANPAAFARLVAFFRDAQLEPYTWNAFPYGEFHAAGVKTRVFEPRWSAPERAAYTVGVAELALRLAEELDPDPDERAHISISTHTGGHSSVWTAVDAAQASGLLDGVVRKLAKLSIVHGRRVRLGLEPEPRANLSTQAELRAWWNELRNELRSRPDSLTWLATYATHLGSCLDLCHSAVEFEEDPLAVLDPATTGGVPIVKVQITNALRLLRPGDHPRAVEALLALDEPRWLHQTNARRGSTVLHAHDLPQVRAALAGPERAAWLEADEWRTHFHVPVDLDRTAGGLTTTFELTRRTLEALLAQPAREDLHLEIETYTWDAWGAASPNATPEAALVNGLEAEYRAVLPLFEAQGWLPT